MVDIIRRLSIPKIDSYVSRSVSLHWIRHGYANNHIENGYPHGFFDYGAVVLECCNGVVDSSFRMGSGYLSPVCYQTSSRDYCQCGTRLRASNPGPTLSHFALSDLAAAARLSDQTSLNPYSFSLKYYGASRQPFFFSFF